jgi:hypothetical protein
MVKDNQKNVLKWAQEILKNGGIGKTEKQKNLLVKIENYIKKHYLDKSVNDVLIDITSKTSLESWNIIRKIGMMIFD